MLFRENPGSDFACYLGNGRARGPCPVLRRCHDPVGSSAFDPCASIGPAGEVGFHPAGVLVIGPVGALVDSQQRSEQVAREAGVAGLTLWGSITGSGLDG
jgi:hypothetical protein